MGQRLLNASPAGYLQDGDKEAINMDDNAYIPNPLHTVQKGGDYCSSLGEDQSPRGMGSWNQSTEELQHPKQEAATESNSLHSNQQLALEFS